MTTLQGIRPELGTRMRSHLGRLLAKKAGVFISYRRDDTAPVAMHIADHLSKIYGQDQIFFDQQDIICGDEFANKIIDSLKHCVLLIAVIGDRWNPAAEGGLTRLDDPNDFVRIEIQTALQRKIDVIPLLVDQAPLPDAQKLPKALQRLNRYQALRINGSRVGTQLEPLVTRVKRLLSLQKLTTIIKAFVFALILGLVVLTSMNPTSVKTLGAMVLDMGGWHLAAAHWYDDIGRWQSAELSYYAALESLDKDDQRRARIECQLAWNLYRQRQYSSAKTRFIECTDGLHKQVKSDQLQPVEVRELRSSLADYYTKLASLIETTDESDSRYTDAVKYFVVAAELYAEESTNNKYWALTLKNLGSLHKGNDELRKARQCFAASLEKFSQVLADLSDREIETLTRTVVLFVEMTTKPAPRGISADSCLA